MHKVYQIVKVVNDKNMITDDKVYLTLEGALRELKSYGSGDTETGGSKLDIEFDSWESEVFVTLTTPSVRITPPTEYKYKIIGLPTV